MFKTTEQYQDWLYHEKSKFRCKRCKYEWEVREMNIKWDIDIFHPINRWKSIKESIETPEARCPRCDILLYDETRQTRFIN